MSTCPTDRDLLPIPKYPDPTSHATASFNTPRSLERLVNAIHEIDIQSQLGPGFRVVNMKLQEDRLEGMMPGRIGGGHSGATPATWEISKVKDEKTEVKGIDAMRVKYQGLMSAKREEDREDGEGAVGKARTVNEQGRKVTEQDGGLLLLEDTDSDGTAIAEEKKGDGKGKKKKNKKKAKKRKGAANAVQPGEGDEQDEREVEHTLEVEVGLGLELDDDIKSDTEDRPVTPTTPKATPMEKTDPFPVIQIVIPSPLKSDDKPHRSNKSPIIVTTIADEEEPASTPHVTPILPQEPARDEGPHANDMSLPPVDITLPFETYTTASPVLIAQELLSTGRPVYLPELTPPNSPRVIDATVQPTGISLASSRIIVIPIPLPNQHPLPPTPLPNMEYPLTPPMSSKVHPLSYSWTLYYLDSSADKDKSRATKSSTDYSHDLVKLSTVSTLEDFFGTWKALRRKIAHFKGRAIEPPNQHIAVGAAGLGIGVLPDDSNFNLFREGIMPMWEDPMCAKGGKIMLAGNANTMDQLFLEVILLVIGGTLDDVPVIPGVSNMVIGVVLSRRKNASRLEIWLGGADEPDPTWVKGIETVLRSVLGGEQVYPYRGFKGPLSKMR